MSEYRKYYMNVVFLCVRDENGNWIVDEPRDPGGYLLPDELLTEISKACKADQRKYKKEYRKHINASWQLEQEREYERRRIEERAKERAEKKDPGLKECTLYLMRDTIRGFYKIGVSKSVKARFEQLKTANAAIEIVMHFPAILNDEKTLLNHFKDQSKHLSGEWFSLDEADVEYIKSYFQSKHAAQ